MSYQDGSYDPMSARRTEELESALAPISWEERARLDSGQAIAPATDENGVGWWNVWVDDSEFPESFRTHHEAVSFAALKLSERHNVHTDFD